MSDLNDAVSASNPANVIDPESLLNSLGEAVVALAPDNRVCFVNHAAEQLMGGGARLLNGRPITEIVPADSTLMSIVDQCRRTGSTVAESDVRITGPRIDADNVNVCATGWSENPGVIILTLQQRTIAKHIDRHLSQRGAARSVTAMSAMLAHEVKNPLSGIRGAAQLLEDGTDDASRQLTQLICDETDRIVALVNRMESFTDDRPPIRDAINIHEVLDHVRRLAKSGFASRLNIIELYDPSLPPVFGSRDQLIQVFLNLVKNAAEAVPDSGGEIQLATRYRHGTRLAVPGRNQYVDLPLEITVRDNGSGIPETVQSSLFDPFVTTKQNGTGLGLALVAKIIDDHGGMIDVDSTLRRTEFRVLLPTQLDAQEKVQ